VLAETPSYPATSDVTLVRSDTIAIAVAAFSPNRPRLEGADQINDKASERPIRSSFQTTSASPSRSASSARASPGRSVPLALRMSS